MTRPDDIERPRTPAEWELLNDLLREGMAVHLPVSGSSMWPFLVAGDIVRLEPVESGDLRVGDIVLWCRPGRVPVMHRIIGRGDGWIRTRGDSLEATDGFVAVEHVWGRMTGIEGATGALRSKLARGGELVGRALVLSRRARRLARRLTR